MFDSESKIVSLAQRSNPSLLYRKIRIFGIICIMMSVVWVVIALAYGLSYHEMIMFVSNLLFILLAYGWYSHGFLFIGILQLGVFFFSNNYHLCYGRYMDTSASEFGEVCYLTFSHSYITLLFDVIFASTSFTAVLIPLMPIHIKSPEYGRMGRRAMTILSSLIIILVFYIKTLALTSVVPTFLDGAGLNTLLMLVNGGYVGLLFTIHIIGFFGIHGDWTGITEYYKTVFHVKRLLCALGFAVIALVIWNLPYGSWFDTHPWWHMCLVIGGFLLIWSFIYRQDDGKAIYHVIEDSK
jgi:hypothetical protein